MENHPVPGGGVDQSRIDTFGRMITLFKYVIILATIVLTGLVLFAR